ncbi:epoxyqueuosine reductase QueH [Candidatus Contubernalis alkaliaceticus]|uniref:epoxyqueuosine reductase QueH n=1 Tax=Candidatus Contubernalis alkaliaceticus TaxID=338645 RepID=UPI001F4C40EE|nr:epoxyqueuosine reductase QueH [Candidatus Contubernalis alkalaceticus]UNC92623.1 epoxyqueuosine reductase QueH [Candidatus Contubernalis alkalaceticus]
MKMLVHMCCAPCSTASIAKFKDLGYRVKGFFYNPNIHPYREFKTRLETLKQYCREEDIPIIVEDRYLLDLFLRETVFHEEARCSYCYRMRLLATARKAEEEGINYISSTLLISPYQDHEQLMKIGSESAQKYGRTFIYEDLRPLFKDSIALSRERGIYRQSYCGCIYSEKERYYKHKNSFF